MMDIMRIKRWDQMKPNIGRQDSGRVMPGWAVMLGVILMCLLALRPGPVQAASLQEWMERALRENPDYQLLLRDHALAVQGLRIEDSYGLKSATLSLSPLSVSSSQGVKTGSVDLQYSGDLPFCIGWSGGNAVSRHSDGSIRFTGQLQMQLDLPGLWERETVEKERERYLDEEHRMREGRSALLGKVVEAYSQLVCGALKVEKAAKQAALNRQKLQQAKAQYEAGVISALAYMTAEDAYQDAVSELEKARRDDTRNRRDFQKLFGQGLKEEELADITSDSSAGLYWNPVKTNQFLQQWDPGQAEEYLKKTYRYEKNQLNLQNAEQAWRDAKKSEDWEISLDSSCTYGSGAPVVLSAYLNLSKPFFSPAVHNLVKQTETRWERQKLIFDEERSRLVSELVDQVTVVKEAEAAAAQARADLQKAKERLERLKQLYDEGYISLPDYLAGEVAVLEKTIAFMEETKALVKAQLQLSQMLDQQELEQ